MIIIFTIIALIALVIGYFVYREDDDCFWLAAGVTATVICIVITAVLITCVVRGTVIDEEIAVMEEYNAAVEQKVEEVARTYMEHEERVFTKLDDPNSYVTMYPELNNSLLEKQIETYNENLNKILELQIEKINLKVEKWWLYFGG